jgi:hypothetical protein
MDGKRRIVIANFPNFIKKGEKETPMREKSEGDTIQKLFRGRIQNVWGEGHGGEAGESRARL